MLALWLALCTQAQAVDTLRAVLRVDDGGVEVIKAVRFEGEPPASSGGIEVVDGDGMQLGTVPMPALSVFRAVSTPEGGSEIARREHPFVSVQLPWTDDARGLRFEDGGQVVPVAPAALQRQQASGRAVAVLETGPVDSRKDLVFYSEGYVEGREAKFDADVDAVVGKLLSIEPWTRYGSMLNVWKVWVPSAQAGLDDTSTANLVDTPFECFRNCDSAGTPTPRLICCDEELLLTAAANDAPWHDGVMVLVDDTVYGGSGGVDYSTSYTGDALALEVAVHELGHTLIHLWDEYNYGVSEPTDGTRFISRNCSPEGEPVAWEPWLDDGPIDWEVWLDIQTCRTETPRQCRNVACDGRPGSNTLDFTCAYLTCSFNDWVRPTANSCLMQTLGDHYCDVCREAVILKLYEAAGDSMVLSSDPEVGTRVRVEDGETVLFTVDAVGPSDDLDWRWELDGELLSTDPDFEVVGGGDKMCGRLELTLTDMTAWVRDDPDARLSDTVAWKLRSGPCCGCAAGGSPGAAGLFLIPLLLLRRRRDR